MKRYFTLFIVYLITFNSQAQTIAFLKRDMNGIASDATEGRFTGSPGYLKAASYVVRQLSVAGLQPGWVEKGKKTYLQPVPFTWDDYTGSTVTLHDTAYPHSAASFMVTQRGIPRKGKWIVLSPGDPVGDNVAGVVLLPNENQAKDWETTVIRQYRFGYMHYLPDSIARQAATPMIMVSPELARNLAKGDSISVVLTCHSRKVTAYNVIARVAGTDKRLTNETMVVGAHLDHIGRIGNHIYNGANDDASGCVAELSAAKAIAARPCKRSVVFVFYTGEELGLKGSRWFVDHLPFSASNLLVNINLEQVGSKHRSVQGVWAVSTPGYEQSFYHSGKSFFGSHLKYSSADSLMNELSNTDGYSFMSHHIPSVLFSSGGFDEHHTPMDKIALIDFEHLRKVALLLTDFIGEVGNQ